MRVATSFSSLEKMGCETLTGICFNRIAGNGDEMTRSRRGYESPATTPLQRLGWRRLLLYSVCSAEKPDSSATLNRQGILGLWKMWVCGKWGTNRRPLSA